MTDTPETDEKIERIDRTMDSEFSLRDFARKLERERDEANDRASVDWSDLIEKFNNERYKKEQAEAERDQLRKVADELVAKLKSRGESDWSSCAIAEYNQLPHVIEKNKSK